MDLIEASAAELASQKNQMYLRKLGAYLDEYHVYESFEFCVGDYLESKVPYTDLTKVHLALLMLDFYAKNKCRFLYHPS